MAEDPDGLLLSLNADQSASSDGESVLAGEVSPLSTHERPVHPPLPGAGAHVTARLVFLCAVSAIGGFLFGYDTGVIGGALLFIDAQWSSAMTPMLDGLVPAATPFGAALGALLGGWLSDAFGRKPTVMASSVIFTLGATVMAFAPVVAVLVVGRFIVGIGVGLVSMAVPIYLSESSPERFRGAIVSVNVLFITGGQFISYAVDLAFYDVPDFQWRWMLGVSAFPAIVQFVGMLFLAETPRWLISRGYLSDAKRVLTSILGDPATAARDMRDICVAVKSEPRGSVADLFTDAANRRAMLIACGLLILQQMCAINTIMYYVPQILKMSGICTLGADCNRTLLVWSLLPAGTNALGTVIGVLLVDRLGRRLLLMASIIGVAATLFAFGLTAIYAPHSVMWTMVVYLLCFSPGLGPVPWAVASEIFPVKVRGIGMAAATAANWLANGVISITFPLLTNSIGLAPTMFGYMVLALLTLAFVYFLVPETKGKTLEEVTEMLRANTEPVTIFGARLARKGRTFVVGSRN